MMETAFGIDFGTTNSACIGILDGKIAKKFSDETGSPVPSVVAIHEKTGEILRGRNAWLQRQKLSESGKWKVFSSIKTLLGTEKSWEIAGEIWTPEKIAAEILKEIKELVYARSGIHMNEAVVSVPVGYSPGKRQALRKAAEMAGIRIKSFVSESTAAIFQSYPKLKQYSKIAVFDWGGGTLDISLVENRDGMIQELAVKSVQLGGDNIDLILAKWAHQQLLKKNPHLNISYEEMSPEYRDRLLVRCEQAKRDLSENELTEIRLNRYGEFGAVRIALDQETFASLIASEIRYALDCMDDVLKEARLDFYGLGCVLLVGGSTNLQPFVDVIEEKWDCPRIYSENPDWSVAHGAAWLSQSEGDYRMAESVGVILSNGTFYPLISRGDSLESLKRTAAFAIVEDTDTANLIFTNDTYTFYHYCHVPTFGFFQEEIDVEVTADQDQILQFAAKSRRRSSKTRQVWKYASPKLAYKLPVTEVAMIDD